MTLRALLNLITSRVTITLSRAIFVPTTEVREVSPQYLYCSRRFGNYTTVNKSFKCSNKACGWIGDADENGSKMIALVGLSVNLAGGSQLLACPIAEGLLKAPVLINKPQVS